MSPIDRAFELGKLYCDRGEYAPSVTHLLDASKGYFAEKNFSKYLNCMNLLLRIYAETEQYEEINLAKEKIQDLVLKEGFELNSKTYYTLAVCASYKGQIDTAMDYLQKALELNPDQAEARRFAEFLVSKGLAKGDLPGSSQSPDVSPTDEAATPGSVTLDDEAL